MSTKPQPSSDTNSTESARVASRTGLFVAAAVGCLLITGLFEWMSRPEAIEEYGKVREPFYPDFLDPSTATSLTVAVIDPEEVKPLEFSVKQQENGQWVIPSHHNYPADAADQLAKTASSVIGIKRGAMVTRWPADHARYGVVDPQTDSVGIDELDGIGKRITFGGKDGEVLASYIVGKKVEGEGNEYYVRHPGEDETYITKLDINLTTRFSDWVKTDLFDITAADVRRLELHDYSFDEMRGTVTGSVDSVLSRSTATDDWKLAGLDDATQEVDSTAVGDSLTTVSSLAIAGVRPKQPGLTADLKIDRAALTTQRDADRLTNDLLARGFLLQPNQTNKDILELIAREGEMFVGTEEGLLYRLYFGRAFTGSSEELEIGLSTDSEADGDAESGDDQPGDDDDEPKLEVEIEESPSGNPGRYVFVRVNFDASLLGEEIKEPVEPKEPEELKALEEKVKAAAEAPDTDEGGAEDEAKEDAAETDDSGEESEEEAEESDKERFDRLMIEYAEAKSIFEEQKTAYADYQKKLEDGKQKAEELNRRFALWYYVIPGDSYDKLSLKRDGLVKAKETDEAAAQQASDNAPPTIGGLGGALMQNPANGVPAGLAAPANDSAPAVSSAPTTEDAAKEATEADAKEDQEGSDQESKSESDATDSGSDEGSTSDDSSDEDSSPADPDESKDDATSDDDQESSDESDEGTEDEGTEDEGTEDAGSADGDDTASEEEASGGEE